MDNVCHTLVGAALAQSGLKKRSPLATITLLIAANIPDVDVLSLFWGGTAGLGFRRGWTHGILAVPLWPFLLAGAVVLFDRGITKRGARFWPLVLVSFVGVVSHPLLDLLNTYGVRLLMPFSDRWFYGDTLFIVDIWVWIMLAFGVLFSVRWERQGRVAWTSPARAALAAAAVYTGGMFVVGRLAEGQVRFELKTQGVPAVRVLASPRPVMPVGRDIVVDEGDEYLVGSLDAGGNLVEQGHWPKHDPLDEDEDPSVAAAAAVPDAEVFLRWARFPTYVVDRRGGRPVVHFIDLRYAHSPDDLFGTLAVPLPNDQVASATRGPVVVSHFRTAGRPSSGSRAFQTVIARMRCPAAVGWMPSAWLRVSIPPTPWRTNGTRGTSRSRAASR